MKLILKRRNGKALDAFSVSEECTVEEFKQLFYDKYHYYPERQWWTINEPRGEALKGNGLLSTHGIHENTVLYFKDLGVQISWRLVFVIEYLGPLFIFPIFYFFPNFIYSAPATTKCLTQVVAMWLLMFHFMKRELETLFVHRFSNSTMPIMNVPLNCGHYWVLCGVFIGYFLFHPKYESLYESNPAAIYGLAALMMVFEILNFKTHLILRSLRARGTRQRGLPLGFGFGFVSCANYLWEGLCWLIFACLVSTVTAWLFFFIGFAKMTEWALKKHRLYKKEFPDYPRNRTAIIPFIL